MSTNDTAHLLASHYVPELVDNPMIAMAETLNAVVGIAASSVSVDTIDADKKELTAL